MYRRRDKPTRQCASFDFGIGDGFKGRSPDPHTSLDCPQAWSPFEIASERLASERNAPLLCVGEDAAQDFCECLRDFGWLDAPLHDQHWLWRNFLFCNGP